MSRKIQHKRGLKENLPILSDAEIGFTTDSKEIYIGSNEGNQQLAKTEDLHAHINKDVLDGLSDDLGSLKYNGNTVGSVTSVNGQTGEVSLDASNVGATTEQYVNQAISEIPEPDLTGLATSVEVDDKIRVLTDDLVTLKNKVGDAELDTETKESLVAAINELEQKRIESDEDLTTHLAESVTDTNGVHGLKIEEGIWTPTIFGLTTEGDPAYASRIGSYYKIGKQVFIRGSIRLTSKGGLQGQVRLGGLPFAPTLDKFSLVIGYLINMNLDKEGVLGQIRTGSVINLIQYDKISASAITDVHIADNFILEFSGNYTV